MKFPTTSTTGGRHRYPSSHHHSSSTSQRLQPPNYGGNPNSPYYSSSDRGDNNPRDYPYYVKTTSRKEGKSHPYSSNIIQITYIIVIFNTNNSINVICINASNLILTFKYPRLFGTICWSLCLPCILTLSRQLNRACSYLPSMTLHPFSYAYASNMPPVPIVST